MTRITVKRGWPSGKYGSYDPKTCEPNDVMLVLEQDKPHGPVRIAKVRDIERCLFETAGAPGKMYTPEDGDDYLKWTLFYFDNYGYPYEIETV